MPNNQALQVFFYGGGSVIHDGNIFVPEHGIVADEVPHQANTLRMVDYFDFDTARPEIILGAPKRTILADNDSGNFVQQNGAATHVAGRERGVQGGTAIVSRGKPPSILKTIHFGVQHRVQLLNSLVVSLANNAAINNEHRANRNSAAG